MEFAVGVFIGLIVGVCFVLRITSGDVEVGRQRGLCEARGGQIVEGVCSKVEVIK